MHRTYTKMLKEDKGTTISDMSMARRILRRSDLSADEQRQVLSSCGHVYDMDKIKDALLLTFGDAHKNDRKRPFATRNAFLNKNGKKGCEKSWRLRKFGTNQVDPVHQDQDDYYEYDKEGEEDGDEQDGQDDPEDEHEEDEDAEQDPEAAPEDDDEQDD